MIMSMITSTSHHMTSSPTSAAIASFNVIILKGKLETA